MKTAPRRAGGFSLVELMVGVAVGLIGIAIITHLYLQNEKYKRSTTAAGGAQVNGAIALYTLERELRAAGFGINHSAALSCTCVGAGCSPVKYYYNGAYAPTGTLPPFMSAPVIITSVNGFPDAISVLAGTDEEGATPTTITSATATTLVMQGTAGYTTGAGNNFVLVAQAGNCMMARVTNVNPVNATLTHDQTSQWNPGPGSTLPVMTSGAFVFNLGVNPLSRSYLVPTTGASAYKLQAIDWIRAIETTVANATVDLVDDIVDMQAEYGRDANGDGVIAASEWTPVVPTNLAEWNATFAVRVGVLARAGNYERPETAGGPCTATTATPTWSGSVDPVTAAVKPQSAFTIPGGLPSCYKYRVFETVIPLRNMIWRAG